MGFRNLVYNDFNNVFRDSWGKTWHTPGRLRGLEALGSGYSKNEQNIGNLPLGEISAVITSPPYSEALSVKAGGGSEKNVLGVGIASDGKKQGQGAPIPYSTSEDNIGNLPHGSIEAVMFAEEKIDACITSPPYLKSAESGGGVNRQREGDVKIGCSSVGRTVTQPEAIDNTKEYGSIDAILTSPPYENAVHCRGHSVYQEKLTQEKSLFMDEYGGSKDNIGNLKRETYLEAMYKVYMEMFKVLKPNGLAIIIVKPFIRQKRVVDLLWHTWLLMAKVGFKLEKLYKLRLKQQSFWRILYARKFPEVERICHEYIIVASKPGEMG